MDVVESIAVRLCLAPISAGLSLDEELAEHESGVTVKLDHLTGDNARKEVSPLGKAKPVGSRVLAAFQEPVREEKVRRQVPFEKGRVTVNHRLLKSSV